MMLSPAFRQASIFGQERSKAANSAGVRQLPKRTQISLTFDSGHFGKVKKVFILTDNSFLDPSIVAENFVYGFTKPTSKTCWQSNPRFRRYLAREAGS